MSTVIVKTEFVPLSSRTMFQPVCGIKSSNIYFRFILSRDVILLFLSSLRGLPVLPLIYFRQGYMHLPVFVCLSVYLSVLRISKKAIVEF